MANSTTHLDTIVANQAAKEVTANAYFDAVSPACLFGRRASVCSGLIWGYYGGNLLVDGGVVQLSNNSLTLAASATNYVEASRTGIVTRNTVGFTPGSIPLYTVATGPSTVTSYTDHRFSTPTVTGRLVKALADANATLTAAESSNDILEFTGTLTAARTVTLPLAARQWTVFNGTAGGFGLQCIGPTGTGITVAAGKRAIIYADGTNIVRVTADT